MFGEHLERVAKDMEERVHGEGESAVQRCPFPPGTLSCNAERERHKTCMLGRVADAGCAP